jgi:hypothetical protein
MNHSFVAGFLMVHQMGHLHMGIANGGAVNAGMICWAI